MSQFRPSPIEFERAGVEPAFRPCDHPGCSGEGLYRAPRSPHELSDYYWFCLDHVRDYNAQWDFFSGMSEGEIDAFRRADVTGHRPTWPIGPRWHLRRSWNGDGLRDLFGLFGAHDDGAPSHGPAQTAVSAERDALAVLNLGHGATRVDIKTRFKELVKRHHPDVNGGDKAAEERLKLVIEAYRLLLRRRPA
ncbi:MAG: J domain-containing protein [Alphaproteobacteria bacterium]